jgi:hypothetical protein
MTGYRRWVLAKRPQGVPQVDDFRLEQAELPSPQDGQALIRELGFVPLAPGGEQAR